MKKLKVFVVLLIIGFLGLPYISIAQTRDTLKGKMLMPQRSNQFNKLVGINQTNKFTFQPDRKSVV